jgi:hypothetical protein
METYTIILEFSGGTYVSQVSAENELSALKFWIHNPGKEMLSGVGFLEKVEIWESTINSGIENGTSWLTPLDTLKSVWFFYFSICDVGGYVNLIKTKV